MVQEYLNIFTVVGILEGRIHALSRPLELLLRITYYLCIFRCCPVPNTVDGDKSDPSRTKNNTSTNLFSYGIAVRTR